MTLKELFRIVEANNCAFTWRDWTTNWLVLKTRTAGVFFFLCPSTPFTLLFLFFLFCKYPVKFCSGFSFYIINTIKKIMNQWLKASALFFLSVQMCPVDLYPSLNHQIEHGKLEHTCVLNQFPHPQLWAVCYLFFYF